MTNILTHFFTSEISLGPYRALGSKPKKSIFTTVIYKVTVLVVLVIKWLSKNMRKKEKTDTTGMVPSSQLILAENTGAFQCI